MNGRVLVLAAALGLAALSTAADDRAEENAILAATVRQQVQEQLDPVERARGTVLCVAIDPGGAPQSPPPALMQLLSREPQLRRVGACDRRPEGAVEAQTLRPAIIVTVGPIERVADDEAHVAVHVFRSARSGAHRTYRVVRDPAGWFSLGPILKDGPALL